MFAPLRAGSTVQRLSTVVERYRKRDRDFVVNEVDYDDESGRLLVRSRTHQSFLADLPQAATRTSSIATARRRRSGARSGGRRPSSGPVELEVDLDLLALLGADRQLPHQPRGGEEARLPRRGRAGNALDLPDVAGDGQCARAGLAGGRAHGREARERCGGERARAAAQSPGGFTRRRRDPSRRTTRSVVTAPLSASDDFARCSLRAPTALASCAKAVRARASAHRRRRAPVRLERRGLRRARNDGLCRAGKQDGDRAPAPSRARSRSGRRVLLHARIRIFTSPPGIPGRRWRGSAAAHGAAGRPPRRR
jgi:hypothetical protein